MAQSGRQTSLTLRGALVLRDGDLRRADITLSDGTIEAIGANLPTSGATFDAGGLIAMPGGVDTHAHIEQRSGMGLMNADTFETATRSAALGGTTSIISFAA